MAVVLKNALFLHIPKTGGEWVRQIFWDAGLEDVKLHPGKQKHADLQWFQEHPEYDRPFRFTFVRHPLSWYRSYWSYQTARHWRPIPEVALIPPTGLSYPEFLEWVVEHHPGFLGRLYQQYTGEFQAKEIDYVGNTEILRQSLANALRMANCRVPWRLIQTFPIVNVCFTLPRAPVELEDAIIEAEAAICQRFGYD